METQAIAEILGGRKVLGKALRNPTIWRAWFEKGFQPVR
jgi:hypothetical protein